MNLSFLCWNVKKKNHVEVLLHMMNCEIKCYIEKTMSSIKRLTLTVFLCLYMNLYEIWCHFFLHVQHMTYKNNDRGKSHAHKMFFKNWNTVKICKGKTLLIKMGRFYLTVSNYIFYRSFLIKMNIEEIKLKNKVTPVCCMFFFISYFYINSAWIGEYGKVSMLKSFTAMLLKKNI